MTGCEPRARSDRRRYLTAAALLCLVGGLARCQAGGEEPNGGSSNDAGSLDAASVSGIDGATMPRGSDAAIEAGAGADGGRLDAGADAARPDSGADSGAFVLGVDPAMGWSTWSFVRQGPTEAVLKAQAQALHDSGLSKHGFIYVNLDDFYYLNPSTNVDPNGRWVVDSTKFPDGMAALGSFIHGLGLKFGMYVTPGVPAGAVANDSPIEGTTYGAASIAVTGTSENNYNFGANTMLDIDYSKPGAQEFIDSWAKLFASYGIDYLKIDGVGAFDLPDVQAWSTALERSGRTIHLELSNGLALGDATTWAQLSNGWRIDGDVECYCGANGSSYPLTDWNNVSARLADDPPWQRYSAPGARNDLDSLELGNGDNDGLTVVERQTQMSFWALAAAPLLLGTDLTNLDSGDVALLTNDEVIAVDQAGAAAKQLQTGSTQIWAADEPDGSIALGMFNLGGSTAPVTIDWSDLGIVGPADVRDLWQQKDLGSMTGSFTSSVSSHGVTLVKIQPTAALDAGAPPAYFPQTCPTGTTYEDPFELDPIASGNWTLTAGTYTFAPIDHTVTLYAGSDGAAQMWIGTRPSWNAYSVSVPVSFPGNSGNGGLNFHVESLPNPAPNNAGQMYYEGITPAGATGAIDFGTESNTNWVDVDSVAGTYDTGVTYQLQIQIAGQTVTVSVNGAAVLSSFTDPSGANFTYGSIALRSWNQTVTFGPVTVTCK